VKEYLNERIGLACIISVLAGLALTNLGVGDTTGSTVAWLAFSVVCGVIINTQKGLSSIRLLKASVLPTFVLLVTVLFRLVLLNAGALSGVPWRLGFLGIIHLSSIAIASFLGIWIFAHSRQLLLNALKGFFSMRAEKAERIEKRVQWLTGFIGSLALLYGAIFG
jgi:hypothetical protein